MRRARTRRALVEAAQEVERSGLSPGTSGNLSVRVPGGFLITPTGVSYGSMDPADTVFLTSRGDPTGDRQLFAERQTRHRAQRPVDRSRRQSDCLGLCGEALVGPGQLQRRSRQRAERRVAHFGFDVWVRSAQEFLAENGDDARLVTGENRRAELARLPGVQYEFSRPSLMSFASPLQVEISGYDLEALAQVGILDGNRRIEVVDAEEAPGGEPLLGQRPQNAFTHPLPATGYQGHTARKIKDVIHDLSFVCQSRFIP